MRWYCIGLGRIALSSVFWLIPRLILLFSFIDEI